MLIHILVETFDCNSVPVYFVESHSHILWLCFYVTARHKSPVITIFVSTEVLVDALLILMPLPPAYPHLTLHCLVAEKSYKISRVAVYEKPQLKQKYKCPGNVNENVRTNSADLSEPESVRTQGQVHDRPNTKAKHPLCQISVDYWQDDFTSGTCFLRAKFQPFPPVWPATN